MNPEERQILKEDFKLAKENNRILKRLQRNSHWAMVWGFIKVLIIFVPLILGYLYLEPFLGSALDNFNEIKGLLSQ